jgi:hypothetical protein
LTKDRRLHHKALDLSIDLAFVVASVILPQSKINGGNWVIWWDVCCIHREGELSLMSSSLTQTQRDLLNNVKQAVALVDKELQRIREQRITICLSGFELDWQAACLGTVQSANGPDKLGSMINAHTDFQAALKEIRGPQTPSFINGNSESLPKLAANGGGPSSVR